MRFKKGDKVEFIYGGTFQGELQRMIIKAKLIIQTTLKQAHMNRVRARKTVRLLVIASQSIFQMMICRFK
ncbi:hypothetical protein HS36_01065 [Listeria monocytogenes]|nr:hypothetical protein HR96_00625 [Listeria monocytogenes]KEU55107.1 hypothetical protein HS92_00980 [Listeria monocytogenes]KEU73376.1 hypothetical protein HS29_01720 [Listeria monocytogenes]KEV28353.1 hypothetical protein HS36_01065 [Listeria monocytogenes]KEV84526.1 hypothetical protein HS66_00430 [Listeria monocytogenes]